MHQSTNQLQTSRLNLSLIGKVSFLELNFADLQNELVDMSAGNPFLDVIVKKTPPTVKQKKTSKIDLSFLEQIKKEESFYSFMDSQIESSRFFPTQTSKNVAKDIVENLSEYGYFEGDIAAIATKNGITKFEAEKIRLRFAFLEPTGVGARDYKEAFLFNLENEENINNDFYEQAKAIIKDFENADRYLDLPYYKDAMNFIKNVPLPPSLDFFEEEKKITADLKIIRQGGEIIVRVNSDFCPELKLKQSDLIKDSFAKEKLKEAKEMINLLSVRNKTITDIALVIVQKQNEFFFGGDLKPLKMQDVADELGMSQGTISRAVANKYIECDKGLFELKSFFAQSISGDLSNVQVKQFLLSLIENEDRKKPLNDLELLNFINARFNIDLSRRSIAKYRAEYGILEKDERKRLYSIMGGI